MFGNARSFGQKSGHTSLSKQEPHGSDLQVVAVGGILGEVLALRWLGNYMKCLEPVFSRILPAATFKIVQSRFFHSVDFGGERVANTVRDTYLFQGRRSVLIGHSRGALECLSAIVKNPDLIRLEMIEKIILLAPPIKGTPVSDFLALWLRRLTGIRVRALDELRTNFFSDSNWTTGDPVLQARIRSITHLIRYQAPVSELCWALTLPGKLLARLNAPNDGMTPVLSQTLPWSPEIQTTRPVHHGFDTCEATLSPSRMDEKVRVFSELLAINPIVAKSELENRRASEARTPLAFTVASYNVGGLKLPLWGVPYPKARWIKIVDVVREMSPDILFFQELFDSPTRQTLEISFPEYFVFRGPDSPRNGLATLVLKKHLDPAHLPPAGAPTYVPFAKQRVVESLVGFEKGYLTTTLRLQGVKDPVYLLNLHLTAFSGARKIRAKQKKQILNTLLEVSTQGRVPGHAIIGGDFNEDLKRAHTFLEPSYSTETRIHRLKHWLNRGERSENIDFVFSLSTAASHRFVSRNYTHLLGREKYMIEARRRGLRLELSDHACVSTKLFLEEVSQ
jgi:endonuclease/exonuclease/phosphatase family metal-dependent hydrolase